MPEASNVSLGFQEVYPERGDGIRPRESATVPEILELVEPTGPLEAVATMRVATSPFFDPDAEGISPRSRELLTEAAPHVTDMRGYFRRLLESGGFIRMAATLPEDRPITRGDLQRLLGIGEGYQWVTFRLAHILNADIDPDLLPLALEKYRLDHQLPESFTNVFRSNGTLLIHFTELIAKPGFFEAWNSVPHGDPYSPGLLGDITRLTAEWVDAA